MKKILSTILGITTMLSCSLVHAAGRNCKSSAKSAVERMDRANPVEVDAIDPINDENRARVISILKKRGARALGLSPAQHQQMLLDLRNGSPDIKYFIVQVGNSLYLSFTDADSCAPYDPIRLN